MGRSAHAGRGTLIESVFGVRRPNATHRARLRVEVSRLRAELSEFAEIAATSAGFALQPHGGADALVLAPPIEGEGAALVPLLGDGAAWSTSALALALGASQRNVQRGRAALEEAGQVRAVGRDLALAEELIARGHDPALVLRITRLVDASEYKRRQMPPGVRISKKAFGRDRRMPITNAFRPDTA